MWLWSLQFLGLIPGFDGEAARPWREKGRKAGQTLRRTATKMQISMLCQMKMFVNIGCLNIAWYRDVYPNGFIASLFQLAKRFTLFLTICQLATLNSLKDKKALISEFDTLATIPVSQ